MSAKPKSALSETPNSKVSPATPRFVSKSSRGVVKSNADSASPMQNARTSVDDQSPKSITPKPTPQRRSPKLLSTPPDKKPTRILKPSEIQAELNQAQEDLKKAKEKLAIVEKEKDKALNELKEAKRLSHESNEKLVDALLAKKRAEESSETEKFRAVELEQANIEEAQKREHEWLKELEAVRSQHAVDVSALLSLSEELQKAKQELSMTCDAKNQALNHAEDATRLAEINAEKVESLSSELLQLKSVLESRIEVEANEKDNYVSELKLEIESLRQKLQMAKALEESLAEKEVALEQLNVDLEAAKMAESYSRQIVVELHERIEELESQTEQAKRMERSASESLESVIKELGGSKDLLHKAESEIAALKEKVGLLEIAISKQKSDLEESERQLTLSKAEASQFGKKIESLMSELETVREENTRSLENEKLVCESFQTLLEEKNKLIRELENSREEEEKSKKALESLASALQEVSSEAREGKEKLLSVQVERENYEKKLEDLECVLKTTEEEYESMLHDSKQEIDALTYSVKHFKHEYEKLKAESEHKEILLMDSVKKSEEDKCLMENEIAKLINLMKLAEEEARASKQEGDRWKSSLTEAESEVIYLKEVLGEAKAESMSFKEALMNKENELRNILLQNEELRRKEVSSSEKMEELLKLLEEEALAKKQNDEMSENEIDHDLPQKVVEFSEQNGTGDAETALEEPQSQQKEDLTPKEKLLEHSKDDDDESFQRDSETTKSNGKAEKEKHFDYSTEANLKMWESCNSDEKEELTRDQQQESIEDELEQKAENPLADSINNGSISPPTKENSSQKKKKPLLRKFGSLLKKKSPTKS